MVNFINESLLVALYIYYISLAVVIGPVDNVENWPKSSSCKFS